MVLYQECLKYKSILQGVLFEQWKFQMAVALKGCNFDPMLVKPKCVWELVDFLKNCNKNQLKIVNKFSKIEKFYHISNAFWLYKHRVKSAQFQHSILQPFTLNKFIWNTLYWHPKSSSNINLATLQVMHFYASFWAVSFIK